MNDTADGQLVEDGWMLTWKNEFDAVEVETGGQIVDVGFVED